jgi:hypothetical protein
MSRSDREEKNQTEDFATAIEKMAENLQKFCGEFLESIVIFIKDATNWLEETGKIISEYLNRFFIAFSKLLYALGKISLFYLPSLFFLLISIVVKSWFFFLLTVGWAVVVTMIGLTYKKTDRKENNDLPK